MSARNGATAKAARRAERERRSYLAARAEVERQQTEMLAHVGATWLFFAGWAACAALPHGTSARSAGEAAVGLSSAPAAATPAGGAS